MMRLFSLFVLCIFFSCSRSQPENIPEQQTEKKNIKKVVILGNSIVEHGPDQGLGWFGNWGMAASVRDSDFVHVLIDKIRKIDPKASVVFKNIAVFEQDYENYDLDQLSALKNPDILIVKLSENVDKDSSEERKFITYYDRLINYLAPSKDGVKIIVDGFWPSPVNDQVRLYASGKNFPFVVIHDLVQLDPLNAATGLYVNEGVAMHPSDKGMRNIALRIWAEAGQYFTKK